MFVQAMHLTLQVMGNPFTSKQVIDLMVQTKLEEHDGNDAGDINIRDGLKGNDERGHGRVAVNASYPSKEVYDVICM